MKIVIIAAAAACFATSVSASNRAQVTARVSTAGLDLTTSKGRIALDGRVHRAAMLACGDYTSRGDHFARLRCHQEMVRDARTQVARRQAKAEQIASVGARG